MSTRDPLEDAVRNGVPLTGVSVVSCHTHLGDGWNHPMYGSDAETMLATMDRVGITQSCVSSMRALGPDMLGGNADIERVVEAHPERYLGTVVANPHFPEESREQLEKYFATGRFGMIKIHPEFHAYPMNGPGYELTFEFANRYRVPVLTHSWGSGRGLDHPSLGRDVAQRYPDLPLVLGHAGGSEGGVHASLAVAVDEPSIYLDTATSLVHRNAIELMVETVGAERVLFGTDAAYLADAPQVARIAGSRLTEESKTKILGENLLNLLRNVDLNIRASWVGAR